MGRPARRRIHTHRVLVPVAPRVLPRPALPRPHPTPPPGREPGREQSDASRVLRSAGPSHPGGRRGGRLRGGGHLAGRGPRTDAHRSAPGHAPRPSHEAGRAPYGGRLHARRGVAALRAGRPYARGRTGGVGGARRGPQPVCPAVPPRHARRRGRVRPRAAPCPAPGDLPRRPARPVRRRRHRRDRPAVGGRAGAPGPRRASA